MKTMTNGLPVAQGDLYILAPIDKLPDGASAVPPVNGKVIVGHSETGHHHVLDATRTTMYRLPDELYECFLVVRETDELRHLRPFDTHETIQLDPAIYPVRRQREYIPEGWRAAQD